MSDPFSGIWEMFASWRVGNVNIIVWIVGFMLMSIIAIFVKGNK